MQANTVTGSIVRNTKVTRMLRWMSGWHGFLPFYHTVATEHRQAHLKHLYKLRSTREFEADLDVFLKYYEPVDTAVYLQRMRDGSLRSRPSTLLTFDDGLSEIYTHIEPLLRAKGVPCVVFLNSAFVNNRDLFFRYLASLLVDRVKHGDAVNLKAVAQCYGLPSHSAADVCAAFMATGYRDRAKLCRAAELMEVDIHAYLHDIKPYLSAEQVSELAGRGVEFGCHSVDHPIYKELSLSEQLQQTRDSAEYVFSSWTCEVRSFAFPFSDSGVDRSFFEKILSEGTLDVAFGGGSMRHDYRDDIIHRTWMEGDRPDAEAILKREFLKCLARKVLGKSRLVRN